METGRASADWFDNDELFFDQLATGHSWAERVATRLREAGFDAEVTPMRRRATIEDRHEFADEIDLVVGPRAAPFEVKSRDLDFGEDPSSYPYDTAFVDTVSGWEAKNPEPVAVVLVSQRTSAMLIVPPSTRPSWTRVRKWDHVRRIEDEWYAVGKERLLSFPALVELMRNRWLVNGAPLQHHVGHQRDTLFVQSDLGTLSRNPGDMSSTGDILDRLRAEHARTGHLTVDRVTAICERRGLTSDEIAAVRFSLEEQGLLPKRTAQTVEGWTPPEEDDRLGPAPDLLGMYLSEIGAHELLMPEDEIRLGRRIRLARDLVKKLNGDDVEFREFLSSHARRHDLAPHEIRIIQEGAEAEERMFVCNLRLVIATARKIAWHHPRLEPLDIVQAGNIGLARAIQKFDPTLGYKFSTYATWWIRQAVHRHLADEGRMVRLPVHVVDTVKSIRRARSYLTIELGRPPTLAELSEWLQEDPAKIQFLEDVARTAVSLDTPVGDGEGSTMIDLVEQPTDDIEESIDRAALEALVPELLDRLDPRQREILELRFGLDEGGSARTLEEVGSEFGVTRERIRQIEKKALDRLRSPECRRLIEATLHGIGDSELDAGGTPVVFSAKKRSKQLGAR